MSLLTHLVQFRLSLQENDRRPRTIDSYAKDVKRFEAWFQQERGESPALSAITPLDVRDYREYMRREMQLSPNTINRRLAGLRVFLNWAVDAGYLAANPGARISGIKQVATAPRWLDRNEQYRLLRALERAVRLAQTEGGEDALRQALRDRAIVLTLLHTGLRVRELVSLQMEDLHLAERKGSVYVREGKGGKSRSVPLNAEAREALNDYLAARPAGEGKRLFLGQRGPIGSRQVQRLLKKYARQAELDEKELTAHALRHTFGKNLVDAGVSLDRVATLLGNANLNTTRLYTTPDERDLQQAVEKVVSR